MKSSSNIKKLKKEGVIFSDLLSTYCDKIKKDYKKILQNEKSKLISLIAEGENLDEIELREKYLTLKKKKEEPEKILLPEEEIILDKVNIDGNEYWYENKEGGKIYNNESNVIGTFKNNNFSILS